MPPVRWLRCSKGWFLHQVRDALRQSQLLNLASRAGHYSGFTVFDRETTVFLHQKLLKHKHGHAAGTLKAILATAMKTAVIFHKSKLVSSPVCPFCTMNAEEDTSHMFDVCPCWADIRLKFSRPGHSQFAASCFSLRLSHRCTAVFASLG